MFLQELRGHENIIEIVNILEAKNDMDIYVVCDFMESDLHNVIKSGILEDVHKQFILYQILKALKYMHSGHLLHRDLKPSNVLLNTDCHVKLCDFGLARSVAPLKPHKSDSSPVMTDYVATRWYRAPELLLGSNSYTKGIDIWAVACILAEMILGKPIFPGNSALDQLEKVFEVTGRPTPDDIQSMNTPYVAQMIESVSFRQRVPLEQLLPRASVEAIDLLKRCFQFNPHKRPSASELLAHPYLIQFHDPSNEPSCARAIEIPLDDNVRLTVEDYRTKLYEEIRKRREETKDDQPVTPSTPPIISVPSPQGATKEYSYRASNLTPTTCQTNKGQSSPPTPASSKLVKSASTKTLCTPVPYRSSKLTPAKVSSPVPSSKQRSASGTRTGPSNAGISSSLTAARSVLSHVTRIGANLPGRLTRTPSASVLGSRNRQPSAVPLKRPTTSFQR